MLEQLIIGGIMGIGMLVIIAQLPMRELWLDKLWIFDTAAFGAFFYMALVIRSTDIAIMTAIAGLFLTITLRLWRAWVT